MIKKIYSYTKWELSYERNSHFVRIPILLYYILSLIQVRKIQFEKSHYLLRTNDNFITFDPPYTANFCVVKFLAIFKSGIFFDDGLRFTFRCNPRSYSQ